MTEPQGRFCWYELMTTDPEAAGRFYGEVVGWTPQAAGSATPYTLFMQGEQAAGGMLQLTPEMQAGGARPLWIGYIGVDDVDAKAREVTQAGGTVNRAPADIPGVGRFAMCLDPGGAPFVLFTPASNRAPPPPGAMGHPGHIGWHELAAADGPSAVEFYTRLFGWTKDEAFDMGAMGRYQLFSTGAEMSAGGIMTKGPEVPRPFWAYYIQVPDVHAAKPVIEAAGGTVINGPMEVPGGAWIVMATDPQGAFFAVISPPA